MVTCLGAIESPESPIWSVQLLAYIPHPEVHLQKKFKKKKKGVERAIGLFLTRKLKSIS